MYINNSVSFGSASSHTAYNQLAADSKTNFRKMLQEKESKAKEDVLDLTFKDGDTKTMSGLSQLQIAYLKSKYDVTNMTDEQFDSLLNDLSGMGAIPPENATSIRAAFVLTPEEEDALRNHTNTVNLVTKDTGSWQASSTTDKLHYFESLCQQHLNRGAAESGLLHNDQQIFDILKLLA